MSAEKQKSMIEIGSDFWNAAKQVGEWTSGGLQGEFNQKMTLGQIIFDAILSMFPVVGEATAVRDLIAIILRMVNDAKELKDVLNWISIILCLLPLIPIVGGVVKGIGRLLVSVIRDITKAKEIASAILAFLRKMGYGDPITFINKLKFSQYQSQLLKEFKRVIARLKSAMDFIQKNMSTVLPKEVLNFIKILKPQLDQLSQLADKMIPEAIKKLDRALDQVRTEMIQQMNQAGAKIGGGQTKVMTNEARLTTTARQSIASKGHKPTPASHYKHKEGWPELRSKVNNSISDPILKYKVISTFSIKENIVAKLYRSGAKINLKRIINQKKPNKAGDYWANKMPENGKAWRLDYAVKSEWSLNGVFVGLDRIPTVTELKKLGISVPKGWQGLKTWEGKVAEQLDDEGESASKLLLPGGETQIYIDFTHPDNLPIKLYIDKMIAIQKTNWKDAILPKDINETVSYLAAREKSRKTVQQGRIARATSATGRANNRAEKNQ